MIKEDIYEATQEDLPIGGKYLYKYRVNIESDHRSNYLYNMDTIL